MTALIFVLLAVCLAASIPIFMSLALVAFIIFFFYGSIPLQILPQRMFAGVEGFALMAIPFFILAANLMGKGGVTARLVRFVNTLVGHFPGGLGICVVMTCLLFGAITGSSASTVVAVGGIMYPALIKSGYEPRFSLGVVTCSALIGMIIPPSNAMIIYGSVSKVSVGALFMAGFGAGIVFALVYAIYCYLYAKKKKFPLQPRAAWYETLEAGKDALWGLGIPFIILGGIYSGVFTPTESAAVAVAYAMVVTRFVYRELSLQRYLADQPRFGHDYGPRSDHGGGSHPVRLAADRPWDYPPDRGTLYRHETPTQRSAGFLESLHAHCRHVRRCLLEHPHPLPAPSSSGNKCRNQRALFWDCSHGELRHGKHHASLWPEPFRSQRNFPQELPRSGAGRFPLDVAGLH